jgi:hypothetical protein
VLATSGSAKAGDLITMTFPALLVVSPPAGFAGALV